MSDQRDQAVDRMLRQANYAAPAATGDVCLDAETLAAWMDGGLSAESREAAEHHVAGCARCLMLVGTMAQTEVVAMPAAVEAPAPRSWFRWLVPATAVAAALLLWVAMPRQTSLPSSAPALEQLSARAEPMAEAPAPMVSPAEAPPANAPADLRRDRAAAAPRAAQGQQETAAAPALPQPKDLRDQAQEFDALASTRREVESKAAAPAAPPPPAAVAPAPSSSGAAVGGVASGNADARSRALLPRPFIAETVVVSADGTVRWSIAADSVSKTVGAGARTYVLSRAGYFTAGAAPSAEVCWLVGRGGLVMRTIDGQTFTAVPFPQTVDLTAVSATDANRATVTTSAGESFSTTDGGRSWAR